MASISAVIYKNRRLVPHGNTGWLVDGIFQPDLPAAVDYVREQAAAQVHRDECVVHLAERQQDRNNRIAERRMREI